MSKGEWEGKDAKIIRHRMDVPGSGSYIVIQAKGNPPNEGPWWIFARIIAEYGYDPFQHSEVSKA